MDDQEPAALARDEHGILVRPALASDVPHIQRLIEPYVARRILLGKDNVTLYGSIQQFRIAEGPDGVPIGCGALAVFWDDIAEVRTLALDPAWLHKRVGHRLLDGLEHDARQLGIGRIFCLTFEVEFFTKHGYLEIGESVVSPEVYAELVRSSDEGVAEFLDLARVKPNTLGNTRMLKIL
ncbi:MULTISPECIES: amino-acid N-acetyltransferase [unclassified Curtobacterium]|uniref:amino-acid N-acetyltransferase n=1 Tax=unclassified Curtobacterium TaxID=257496 RepID=UPI000DAACB78|nr:MULTISPECIES: amino-acid N-acetyltransferase [unclassified Curtobacterium]PZE26098.1 amino-acid N-acetyltransferase [Curtobacterium sp. MCBD17_028]PZF62092.1 amino-acid N-acetyltransferase [Curtobacterium sp. MCBD17_034]PZF63003.1 amino-acid N-acetyltransferase [Curtobacterium sp. MCBD17_013]PZM33975.1 amino-acid N-acetyltransferase [Curtobacterium sp. MCBD17_031]WIB63717.1 amino-acid N-acetyltransferase [Curtobacterium sp. MCBD17_040]